MGTKEKPLLNKVVTNKKYAQRFAEDSSHFKHISKLRSRIHKILDEQFNWMILKLQKETQMKNFMNSPQIINQVVLNEPKLEEWVEMFKHEILQIKVSDRLEKDKMIHKNLQQEIPSLKFPRPLCLDDNQKVLWSIQSNKLNVFRQDKDLEWQESSYEFAEGVLKRYSSVTYIRETNQFYMIGGSKLTNPNIKSSKITCLDLKTSQLKTLLNLPYGLSSHSTVYHKEQSCIYIIGGNKNYSIVTRGCFRLDLREMVLEEISCLNYPVSSASCILWKHRWIYKFGGVGEAFGQWNTSPYIERYSIESNEWEVINPSIRQGISLDGIFQNMFLAKSTAYICEDQEIFVFGGYSIQGEFKNYGFLLRIEYGTEQDQETQENQEKHIIEDFGKIYEQNIRGSLNPVVFTQKSSKQIVMFSLFNNQDSNQPVKPYQIHRFCSQNETKY